MPATRWRVFIIFLAVLIPAASPLSFNISPITSSDSGRINVSGDAVVDAGGIRITPSKDKYKQGRATYTQPLQLWDKSSTNLTDFTTHFSFTIDSDGSTSYGDGMTFFLAPLNSTLQDWSLGGGGLGLGYGKPQNSTSPSTNFIAVEFDTFLNDDYDPTFSDRSSAYYPHVGIDINNMSSTKYTAWRNNVTGGFENDAWISYNATTLMLTVEFTGRMNDSIMQRGSLGYEVDLRDYLPEFVAVGFSAATGEDLEQHVIESWSFSSTLQLPPNEENNKKGLIYGSSVGLSLLILGSAVAFCVMRKRKKEKKQEEEGVGGGELRRSIGSSMDRELQESFGPRRFSYEELIVATNNFAIKLGQGGFGCVYKGFLAATNKQIAVKKVSEGSKQGRKEYAAEIKIISQLRHMNLVQLMGWCHQGSDLLLVYEFMPNGSLDSHLFKLDPVLRWETRQRVAQGLASALLYLHEELGQYVVHRDIKASNIMLDSSFNAKLGDFGLARFVEHDKDLYTTNPAGTIGYMAPEYLATGRASKETDVYSFGVVLLEITCGRRPIDHEFCNNQVALVEWVWNIYGSGQLLDAADPKLDSSEYDARKIERLMVIGLWCVHPDSRQRPSMRQVMQVLNSEAPLPSLPRAMPKPVFDYSNASRAATTSSSSATYSGGGESSSAGPTSDLPSPTDPRRPQSSSRANASQAATTTSSSSATYSGGGASSSAGPTSDLPSPTDPRWPQSSSSDVNKFPHPTPVFQQPQQPLYAAASPSFEQQQQPTRNEAVQQVVSNVIDGLIEGAATQLGKIVISKVGFRRA